MKVTLERLRYKGTFNQQGYKELPNGNIINTNEKLFDFWFGYYKTVIVTKCKLERIRLLKGQSESLQDTTITSLQQ
ncbi:hypothetical protein [Lactiplantibacillus plantarum]|uniref:hypothetical protein n=1 Tax=Lactiplantibacillus plantarum TaxID=1590 RepID=UPI000E660FA4|nr:hypothetical protein [Lactiplantibacillus plantarum]